MSRGTESLISYIRAVAGAWRNDPRDDVELLTRFVDRRDETAFEVLIDRHGALVWQTCRCLLNNLQDTEDAFQATFLALSRKSGRTSIKNLAAWLYKVARHAALRVRLESQRQQKLEHDIRTATQKKMEADPDHTQFHSLLNEELANLPEKLRIPLLLHYLEGKSQSEVARILGCARNTLQKRLAKGEAILRKQLERRGLTWESATLATLFSATDGLPALPIHLIKGTVRAVVAFRSGALDNVTAIIGQSLAKSLAMKSALHSAWWKTLSLACVLGVGAAGLVSWKVCINKSKIATPAASDASPEVSFKQ